MTLCEADLPKLAADAQAWAERRRAIEEPEAAGRIQPASQARAQALMLETLRAINGGHTTQPALRERFHVDRNAARRRLNALSKAGLATYDPAANRWALTDEGRATLKRG